MADIIPNTDPQTRIPDTSKNTNTIGENLLLINNTLISIRSKLGEANSNIRVASKEKLGGVKIGDNVNIDSEGIISVTKDNILNALESADSGSETKYLKNDGSWDVPPNTEYELVNLSTAGLMSPDDKIKLTNIEPNANKYVHPNYDTITQNDVTLTPQFGESVKVERINVDNTGHVTKLADKTITLPNNTVDSTKNGLMSSTDKVKLDGYADVSSGKVGQVLICDGNGHTAWTDFDPGSSVKRYGFRIRKDEKSPKGRVEYILDAAGIMPAHMDFKNNIFDYGGWKDVWFVKNNKPLMLKLDGTVDYYLNATNYARKEHDNSESAVGNITYKGNAMAQIPLCYVCRYEDDMYEYQIISNVKFDNTYKAYAHTNSNGDIREYFYYSIYKGYLDNSGVMRSLGGGKILSQKLTAIQEINACKANGRNWSTHTYAQRELIKSLLVLMAKSTDLKTAYGNGRAMSSGISAESTLPTGTLDTLNTSSTTPKYGGQFMGFNSTNENQVKVFHIEGFWGDQWDRIAGFLYSGNKIHVKMTEQNGEYSINNIASYYNTDITPEGSTINDVITNRGYITKTTCNEYGHIATEFAGTNGKNEYCCDYCEFSNTGTSINYGMFGGSSATSDEFVGPFAYNLSHDANYKEWDVNCGLSYLG